MDIAEVESAVRAMGLKPGDTLKIRLRCGDERLAPSADRENKGKTINLSNVGGNFQSARGDIELILKVISNISREFESLGLEPIKLELRIVTHGDCGAMALVFDTTLNGKTVKHELEVALVSQFRNQRFETIEQLESLNPGVQRYQAEAFAKANKIKLVVEFMPADRLPEHSGKHVLAVIEPSATPYKVLFRPFIGELKAYGLYVAQGARLDDLARTSIAPFIEKVGTDDIRFIAETSAQAERLKDLKKYLEGQSFNTGNKVLRFSDPVLVHRRRKVAI